MRDRAERAGEAVIASLHVHRRKVALTTPFITAVRSATDLEVTLVESRDRDGRSGWGEAAVSWRVTGESPESVAAVVAGPLTDAVIGVPAGDPTIPGRIQGAVWGNAAARSAVECAIADLAAVQAGVALAAHRGAAGIGPIQTDITISAGGIDETVAAVSAQVARGFSVVKLKMNAASDVAGTLAAVREVVGDETVLRIDANQAWSVDDAIARLRAVESRGLRVELIEQPVPAADLGGLARVRAATEIPILADESVRTAADVDAVVRAGAADLVNLKLAKTGGPSEALRAAHSAHEAGLGVVLGCMLESVVGVGSAAALARAVAPDAVHDLDGGLWLREQAVQSGPHYVGDRIVLADAPGLGITGVTS